MPTHRSTGQNPHMSVDWWHRPNWQPRRDLTSPKTISPRSCSFPYKVLSFLRPYFPKPCIHSAVTTAHWMKWIKYMDCIIKRQGTLIASPYGTLRYYEPSFILLPCHAQDILGDTKVQYSVLWNLFPKPLQYACVRLHMEGRLVGYKAALRSAHAIDWWRDDPSVVSGSQGSTVWTDTYLVVSKNNNKP